ncbi:MAG: carboxypeptidase-like regulatory domain-containing protein [Bacteroidales bacterium]|nr:carboxypeptidase-like regulatory domain-containing protein [Bacteroidales bacterium]MBN2698216.1 carboxypeptidase-like regulatory domain-containing protein [Bacteroidales bacterium]
MRKRYIRAAFCRRIISFIFIGCLSLHAIAQSDQSDIKISISARNQPLRQIFEEITLQTGYFFTYDANLVRDRIKTDLQIEEVDLDVILDSLLRPAGLSYRIIDRNIVFFRENQAGPEPSEAYDNHALINGIVLDRKTGKALPYATIGLSDTNLGAITNQSGTFSFKIPADIQNPLLVVSYIGYNNQYVPVSYPVAGELIIELEPRLISLQEVVIRYQDPVSIVKESLNRIPDNYLSDYSRMYAFYRELVSRNDHYMILSEAILDIAKAPYQNEFVPDRVKIFKGRKIMDVTSEDTILLKIKSGIYTSLDLDIIKNPPNFLSEHFTDLYNFDFSDIISYGNNLVYVIRFTPRSHIEETLFIGNLYIDMDNLAIIAADFRFDPEKVQREQGLFVVSKSRNINIRPLSAAYHVGYRMTNGRYHISQVRADVELKIRKRRKWIGSRYNIALEMAITKVSPGEQVKIVPGERVKPNSIMSEETFEYDPEFWGIHNIIEPEKSLEEAFRQLNESLLEYLLPL